MSEGSRVRCLCCSHPEFRRWPRLQVVFGPLLIAGVPLGVVLGLSCGAAGCGWMGWAPLTGLLIVPAVLRASSIGRRLYWGGLQCVQCGHFEMYR